MSLSMASLEDSNLSISDLAYLLVSLASKYHKVQNLRDLFETNKNRNKVILIADFLTLITCFLDSLPSSAENETFLLVKVKKIIDKLPTFIDFEMFCQSYVLHSRLF